jgi:hypothetical protein
LLEALAMVHPIAVRSLDELARSRRGMVPPGSTLIHIGGIHHSKTMSYLLGLQRTGHHVVVLHTGRGEPPQYPEFEMRDGRGLFLEPNPSSDGPESEFKRPSNMNGNWDDIPVSVSVTKGGR